MGFSATRAVIVLWLNERIRNENCVFLSQCQHSQETEKVALSSFCAPSDYNNSSEGSVKQTLGGRWALFTDITHLLLFIELHPDT